MARKNLYIYGTGTGAEVASKVIQEYTDYRIAGYVVDAAYYKEKKFLGRSVITFDKAIRTINKNEAVFFISLGYSDLNRNRREVLNRVKEQGFKLVSIIHPKAQLPGDFLHGENCFIMNDVHIHPCVEIGDNNFIWSGAILCHHVRVENDCWFTSGSMIAGSTSIGSNCFFGVGATVTNNLSIADNCFVGAGTLVSKNLPENAVVVRPSDELHSLNSFQFAAFLNNKF